MTAPKDPLSDEALRERPALQWLLGVGHLQTPPECCDCPFATPDPNSEAPNPADPGEGDYRCSLLGDEEVTKRNDNPACWTHRRSTVWGENPKCTNADWVTRARNEIAGLTMLDNAIRTGGDSE